MSAEIPTTMQRAAQHYDDKGYVLAAWDRATGKGPRSADWGLSAFLPQHVTDQHNIGCNHALSRTCCLDLDDLDRSRVVLEYLGLDIDELTAQTTAWQGNPARLKLLFAAPQPMLAVRKIRIWLRPDDADQHTVLELRGAAPGKQAQDVLPPSIHPDTQAPYEFVTPLRARHELPELPAALLDVWRSWDAYEPRLRRLLGDAKVKPAVPERPPAVRPDVSVIDAFNARHTAAEILERNGYTQKGKRWLRPGSATGVAGIVQFPDGAIYAHGGGVLADDKPHDAFDLYRILEHNGDWRASVRTAADLLGIARSAGTAATAATVPSEPSDPVAELRASLLRDLHAPDDAIDTATAPRFIVPGRLPVCGANLAAPGGSGKTTLTIAEFVAIACGHELYGAEVEIPGPCVLLTAEDGANYGRYVVRRVLEDGAACGDLTDNVVRAAKSRIRIVEWSRARFGPIAYVDAATGNAVRAAAFDTLLEVLANHRPAYVSLDPLSLFSPGERFGNDLEAFLASALHEAALNLGALVQATDHVSQAVAMTGDVHQHAARGGTAKTDNARLARQLVKVRPEDGGPLPHTVSDDDVQQGRVLRLHWTKANYCALPPPVWLKRRGFWVREVRALSAEEARERREREAASQMEADLAAVLATIADKRLSQRDLEDIGAIGPGGHLLSRKRLRAAIGYGKATGRISNLPFPETERQGGRTHYLGRGPSA